MASVHVLAVVFTVSADTILLRDLDLTAMTVGDGKVTLDANVYGEPLVVGGESFETGIGSHASSRYELTVEKGAVSAFTAKVGLVNSYPQAKLGSVRFHVYADGRIVAQTPLLAFGDKAVDLKADLKGAKTIGLEVNDAGDGVANDIVAWLEAAFTVEPGTVLKPVDLSKCEQLGLLTPKAPEAPRINPPRVFGVRPGHPILFTLPVSGVRPMRYAVKGLPEGAIFDPATGWNSWNCFAAAVTGDDIRKAAKTFAASGLMDYGWSYINIDAPKFVRLIPGKGAGLAPGVTDCRDRAWRRLYDGRGQGSAPCGGCN